MTARFTLPSASSSPPAGGGRVAPEATAVPAEKRAAPEMAPAPVTVVDRLTEGSELDDVFVPQGYEQNYAYPLIVWLHTNRPSRSELPRVMRQISDRNYLGTAVVVDPERAEETVFDAVSQLRRRLHIHTERVYLAGAGDAGTLALQIGLNRPEWFAGIVALSAAFPESPRLLARYNDLRGKRVLLAVGQHAEPALLTDALFAQRLLWSAGLNVTARVHEGESAMTRGLLAEIDRWIMQPIEQPAMAF